MVRRPPSCADAPWLALADQVVYGDLNDAGQANEALAAAMPDYVLHLAGLNAAGPSWNDPAAVLRTNVMGTVHLLEAVRRLPGGERRRVLVAGSMLRFPLPGNGEPPAPPHPYSLSKTMQVLAAQSWAVLYGLGVVVAEPSNLIGPGRSAGLCALIARYAAAAERAAAESLPPPEPMRLSSRTERRDLLDVRDAMRAYELLLLQGESGRVYPVASGWMRPLGELADAFAMLASCPLHWSVSGSEAPSPEPSDTAAIRALGWSPRIPLEQSLRDTLDDARAKRAAGG